jgi:hypothetical protein
LQNKLLDNINTIFYLEDSVVKTMWWFQLLLLIVLKCVSNAQVTTPSGKIEGSTLTSRLGKTIYSFRGIRYAKAPISELRFKVSTTLLVPKTFSNPRQSPIYEITKRKCFSTAAPCPCTELEWYL